MTNGILLPLTTVRGAPDLQRVPPAGERAQPEASASTRGARVAAHVSLQNTATLCLRSLAPAYKAAGSHATAYKGTNEEYPKVRKATAPFLEYQ